MFQSLIKKKKEGKNVLNFPAWEKNSEVDA